MGSDPHRRPALLHHRIPRPIIAHSPAWIAGHLAHEYAHNAGFKHSPDRKPGRPHTVPYAFGEIVYDVCVEEFGDETTLDEEPPRRGAKGRGVIKKIIDMFT